MLHWLVNELILMHYDSCRLVSHFGILCRLTADLVSLLGLLGLTGRCVYRQHGSETDGSFWHTRNSVTGRSRIANHLALFGLRHTSLRIPLWQRIRAIP